MKSNACSTYSEPPHHRRPVRYAARTALLAAVAFAFGGCAVVGPQSIIAGRGVYTEVLNRTENEQILSAMVRIRYHESYGMVAVAAITASLSFKAQAGSNIGIGSSDNYRGNLVPFEAGVAYEENPTISYTPLHGEDFSARMLTPISVSEWLLLDGVAKFPDHVFALAVRRLNGLRNPLLGKHPSSPRFARVVELYSQLRRDGVLDYVSTLEDDYLWDIHGYKELHRDSVRELLDLLGITVKVDGNPILLPIRQAIGRSGSAIHVQTRSVSEVLGVFGAGIEIPSDHFDAGLVEPINAALSMGRPITIHSSEQAQDDAVVQIRFRDHWFYIASNDVASKRAFVFFRTLIGLRLADAGSSQQAPVLTVPVK